MRYKDGLCMYIITRQIPTDPLQVRVDFSGAFSIVVKDPLYPSQPLYDYDVGAACPVDFSVTFSVPTDASDDYDKTLLVHIVDSYRTIKVTVLRPATNHTQQTFGALIKTSEL